MSFIRELESLVNKYSVENVSDTPDFILAQYVERSLTAFAIATRDRDKFYGFSPLSIPDKFKAKMSKKAPHAAALK